MLFRSQKNSTGHTDFAGVLKAVKESGYSQYCSFEGLTQPNGNLAAQDLSRVDVLHVPPLGPPGDICGNTNQGNALYPPGLARGNGGTPQSPLIQISLQPAQVNILIAADTQFRAVQAALLHPIQPFQVLLMGKR